MDLYGSSGGGEQVAPELTLMFLSSSIVLGSDPCLQEIPLFGKGHQSMRKYVSFACESRTETGHF